MSTENNAHVPGWPVRPDDVGIALLMKELAELLGWTNLNTPPNHQPHPNTLTGCPPLSNQLRFVPHWFTELKAAFTLQDEMKKRSLEPHWLGELIRMVRESIADEEVHMTEYDRANVLLHVDAYTRAQAALLVLQRANNRLSQTTSRMMPKVL